MQTHFIHIVLVPLSDWSLGPVPLYVPLGGGLPAVSSLGPLIGVGLAALGAGWFFLRNTISQALRKLRGKSKQPAPEETPGGEQSSPDEEAIRKRLEGLGYIE